MEDKFFGKSKLLTIFERKKGTEKDEEVDYRHNVNYNIENSTGQLGGVIEREFSSYIDSQMNFAQHPFFFETNSTILTKDKVEINDGKVKEDKPKFIGSPIYKRNNILR